MSGLVAMSASCLLLSSETVVRPTEASWESEITWEIGAREGCDGLVVVLPPGDRILDRTARWKRAGGGKRAIDEDHWEALPARLDGVEPIALHLPELMPGDEARVHVHIAHDERGPYRWRPGLDGAMYASLEAEGAATTYGDLSGGDGTWWVTDPDRLVEVRLHRGDPTTPAAPWPVPQEFPDPPHQTALEALADVGTLVLLPRGVDGPAPMSGPQAMRRGAVDDRGFARTLVMRTEGGPDRVEIGAWLPEANAEGHADAEEGLVAVWYDGLAVRVLAHPSMPARGGRLWTPSGVLDIPSPAPSSADPYAAATREQPRVMIQTARLIDLPDGADPQRALYPGGGSGMFVREVIAFPVDGRARPWVVDLPEGIGDVGVRSDPPEAADPLWTMRMREGDAAVVVGPTDHRFALILEWVQPDAPACGIAPDLPGVMPDRVEASRGSIVADGDRGWRLESWEGEPVIPDRERLIAGLDARFDARSMPEPALPMRLKFARASWELAAELRPTLWAHAGVGDLPAEPGWPRPLLKARRSGAVTPLEAALIVHLYAIQSSLPSRWVMVRPAWEPGTPPAACPAAYPAALVTIDFEGETRWIDPGCASCAPFEIRPELLGAAALGPGIDATPPPVPGRFEVDVGPGAITWTLEGPAALRFREWLARIPKDEREKVIAERVGGPGATLIESSGIPDAGAPIALAVHRPDGPFQGEDPLRLPPPRDSGWTWLDWPGERRLVIRGEPQPERESDLQVEGARWHLVANSEGVVETLVVTDRLLDDPAARALRRARVVAAGE